MCFAHTCVWQPVKNGRLLTVTFDGSVSSSSPFTFRPQTRAVKVVAGETALAFFTCKNLDPTPVTGVATYNVYPPKAGLYFNKVQCFCFEEQVRRGDGREQGGRSCERGKERGKANGVLSEATASFP